MLWVRGGRERSGPSQGPDGHGSRCGTARCDDSTGVPGLERCADLLPNFIDEPGLLRLVPVASKFSDEVHQDITWPTTSFQGCWCDLHSGVLPVFVGLHHACSRARSRAAAATARGRSVGASDRKINEIALAQWSVSNDVHSWHNGGI